MWYRSSHHRPLPQSLPPHLSLGNDKQVYIRELPTESELNISCEYQGLSMAGLKTAEYQVVQNRFDSIPKLSQFSVGPLANGLFAKGLIDVAHHGVATNPNQPALDRATGLVTIILARIENKASIFNQYVSVLKSCDLENIASDLESDMAERTSHGSSECCCMFVLFCLIISFGII